MPSGPEVLPFARAEEERIEAEWRAHLGPERMGRLRDALIALRDITDPYQVPDATQPATGSTVP